METGHLVREENDKESKPTFLSRTNFNFAKFISGLAFDNSLSRPDFNPFDHQGAFTVLGMVVGGALSALDSLESVQIDIEYYKDSVNGQKRATIYWNNSDYHKTFANWDYNIPVSLRDLYKDMISYTLINEFAKSAYGKFKGVIPNDDYQYDLSYTLDERRKDMDYFSQLFLGKGKMYEYVNLFQNEKIEIIVRDAFGISVIDKLNILPLLNPVSKVSEDIQKLFDLQTIS